MLDSHFNRIPFPWGVAFYGSHGNKRLTAPKPEGLGF
jgi:hypothetical protein